MKKIFLGAPGSGKGTYSRRIAPKRKVPHISTGDILRENIKNKTDIGNAAKSHMDKGELVPDEIIIDLLKQRISQSDCENGFILDGFPRTIEQAEAIKKLTEIDAVINLNIPEDILIEKICARRVCNECGDIYNIADINRRGIRMPPMNPKQEGICDKCGGNLIQRDDDNEEIVKQRLEVYKKETQPLIDFYNQEKKLRDFYVTGPPEEMSLLIIELLEEIESELLES